MQKDWKKILRIFCYLILQQNNFAINFNDKQGENVEKSVINFGICFA
jgi:hypothetical protein